MRMRRQQRGYTLLEYVAGAALIMLAITAVNAQLRTGFTAMATNISSWMTNQQMPANQ